MGDGKRLKEILDSKKTNIRQISKATGIKATTLYSIVQRDASIRLDFALQLAKELGVDVKEISSAANTFLEDNLYGSSASTNGLSGLKIMEVQNFISEMVKSVDNKDNSYFFHIARYSSREPFWTLFACKGHYTMCGGHFCLDNDIMINDVLSALTKSGWRIEVGSEFYFDWDEIEIPIKR